MILPLVVSTGGELLVIMAVVVDVLLVYSHHLLIRGCGMLCLQMCANMGLWNYNIGKAFFTHFPLHFVTFLVCCGCYRTLMIL